MRFSEGGSRNKYHNSQLVTKNKKIDLVEGSTSSKKEKETTGRAEASNIEKSAPQTLGGKKEK
jgi:hypothetical protein